MRHTIAPSLRPLVAFATVWFLLSAVHAVAQTRQPEQQQSNPVAPAEFKPPVPVRFPSAEYTPGLASPLPEAVVSLWVIVNERGRVASIVVVKPASPELNEAAVAALSKWEFEPATQGGIAVPSRVSIDVIFKAPKPYTTIREAFPVSALVNTEPAFKVGNGVSAPRLIYGPDPEYTKDALKKKIQGVVPLWVVVGPDGVPRNIRVVRSLDDGLDQNAVKAVQQWRFSPATKNGNPVAVMINVEVNYKLSK